MILYYISALIETQNWMKTTIYYFCVTLFAPHKGFYVHNVLAKKDNLTSQQNNNEYRVKQ